MLHIKAIFLILLSIPLHIVAQRNVDLDRFYFTVQMRSLPRVYLDSTYRTYNIVTDGTGFMKPFVKDLAPENMVHLDGWKRLASNGHITLHVRLDDLLPESFTVKERTESIKDRNGRITGTRSFYSQEIIYTFSANVRIADHKGMPVSEWTLADRNHRQTYRSPEFQLRQMAEAYFLMNSIKITQELYRTAVTRAMRTLDDRADNEFGYGIIYPREHLWIVGSRKHAEYDLQRSNVEAINTLLFKMNANDAIDPIRKEIQPYLAYFENIPKIYSSGSKHDRKMRYAAYYNLSVLHYYLDHPQEMMKYAGALVLNDFDARDGRTLQQSAQRLREQFQQLNVQSRHFRIDTSLYKGPDEPM